MTSTSRRELVALTLAGFGVAVAGAAFCFGQIYKTAQLSDGDGTGMQWVILTPLTMLFLFIVVPAFVTGMRGLRLIKLAPEARCSPVGDDQREDGAAGQAQARRTTENGVGEAAGSGGSGSAWQALPGRDWLIALGLLALYLLAPFVLAPLFGLFMDE